MSNIKINLMLKEYAPPRQAGALEWGIAAAAVLAVVGLGMYYTAVAAETGRLTERAATQEQRLHKAKAQLAEAGMVKRREERVGQAEGELMGLVGRRWSNLLLTLRDQTPQHVTWDLLSVNGEEMVLEASSRGLVDVAQLFAGLMSHPQVAEVALSYVRDDGVTVEYKAQPGKDLAIPQEGIRPPVRMEQLAFRLVITLARQEGGVPHGA